MSDSESSSSYPYAPSPEYPQYPGDLRGTGDSSRCDEWLKSLSGICHSLKNALEDVINHLQHNAFQHAGAFMMELNAVLGSLMSISPSMQETPVVKTGCTHTQAKYLRDLREVVMLRCVVAYQFTRYAHTVYVHFWAQMKADLDTVPIAKSISQLISKARTGAIANIEKQLQIAREDAQEFHRILNHEELCGEEFRDQLSGHSQIYHLLEAYMEAFGWFDRYFKERLVADSADARKDDKPKLVGLRDRC